MGGASGIGDALLAGGGGASGAEGGAPAADVVGPVDAAGASAEGASACDEACESEVAVADDGGGAG